MTNSVNGMAAKQPTKESVEKSRLMAELKSLRIKTSTEVKEGQPIISVDGVKVLELEDIAALKAKQKQGKTTALKVIVAALLKGKQFRPVRLKAPIKLPSDSLFSAQSSILPFLR